MSLNDDEWFTEADEKGGTAFGLRIHGCLHREHSPYQEIAVYDTTGFGRLLVIDGYIMLSDRDNFIYHEMMAHPALFTHAAPRRVVVIGGGDCGSLGEVLKHQGVESVIQIDIDERVTRVAEEYFPDLAAGAKDSRARLLFEDGIAWMRAAPAASADVIIVDSTDPVGPAEGLFNAGFYAQCSRVLGAGGILVHQSESPLLHLPLLCAMRKAMREGGFDALATLGFPQPVYPSGWWSATLARKGARLEGFREAAAERKSFPTRYYTAAVHRAARALPPFVTEAFDEC
ncbi:MAG: polyamine aminopropyltransferase [Gammaproteobacteria bacterium]|nr:polyamine aminopropyltransferase [Gammaproteobacteria bacterium]